MAHNKQPGERPAAAKNTTRACGKALARLPDHIIFGAVIAALALVPLVFTGLTPSSSDIKLVLIEILVPVALVAWLAGSAVRREIVWPRTWANLPLLVFLGASALSLALSSFRHASVLELWRVLLMAGLYFLGVQLARDKDRLRWIARVIAATAGIVAVYGIMQRLGLDPADRGASPVSGRSFSTCGHPNFLAAYLAMSLPVTGALFLTARSRKAQALWGIDIGLQVLCLYFTFSRGGWLGGLGAAGALVILAGWPSRFRGFFRKPALRGWTLAGVVVAAIALGSVIGSEYSPFTSKASSMSIDTRVQIYKGGLRMFGTRPVLGHGAGTFQTVFPRFRPLKYREIDPRPNVVHAHCEYLMILDEMGVVGLGIFAWLVFAVAWLGFVAIRDKEAGPGRLVLMGLFAGVTGLLVHGTFCVVLRTPVPELHLWLALGILAASPAAIRMRRIPIRQAVGITMAAIFTLGAAVLLYFMSFRPFVSNVRERKGSALKRVGRWEDAARSYESAVKLDPWNLEARYERAVCLVELERYGEAIEAYRGIEALAPDYVHIHYNMGMIHTFMHDWEKAAGEFRRAGATGSLPLGFEPEEALAVMESDISDEDRELCIFSMVARARFGEEARLRGIEEADLAQDVAAKGTEYYLAGKLGRAGVMFRYALSLKPDDRAVMNNLAGIHFQRKDYDEAIELCEELLEIDPADAHVATNLAKAWLLKGNKRKAVEILDNVLSKNPEHPEAQGLLRKIRPGKRRPQ